MSTKADRYEGIDGLKAYAIIGIGYARNSGLAVAKGKYVSFVDSDDTVSSEHFRELLRVAEKYHADACLTVCF